MTAAMENPFKSDVHAFIQDFTAKQYSVVATHKRMFTINVDKQLIFICDYVGSFKSGLRNMLYEEEIAQPIIVNIKKSLN